MVTLMRGFMFLVVFGAGGWVYYYYYWQYRLPQERVLTDEKGQAMQVRLDGRADDAVRFTLLSDGTMHYYPIALLSAADQAFATKLPVNLTLGVPLDYVLTDPHGKSLPVRIEGRDDNWIRYTTPTDAVAHYSLISSLNPTDQALVQLLPTGLVFQYPVDYTLTDSQGRPHAVRFLGHSTAIVKYSVVADGSIQVQPIASLSAQDQSFVKLLPPYIALDYPVDRTMTDVQGKTFDAHILGRSTGVVKLTLASDGTTQYYPVSSLSDADQKFLQQLPLNLSLRYPMEYNLTDQAGKSMNVRIEASSPQLVKFTLLTDASTHYYPIALLSEADQKLLWQMPAVSLNLNYPLECSLTDQGGRELAVRLEGRSDEAVKFTLLADGTTHNYPLSKLGAADQMFLKMLSVNLSNSETITASTQPSAVDSAVVQNLLDRLATLKSDDTDIEVQIASPNTMGNDRMFLQEKLTHNKSEIKSLQKELEVARNGGNGSSL
jgi:hypothetical protein